MTFLKINPRFFAATQEAIQWCVSKNDVWITAVVQWCVRQIELRTPLSWRQLCEVLLYANLLFLGSITPHFLLSAVRGVEANLIFMIIIASQIIAIRLNRSILRDVLSRDKFFEVNKEPLLWRVWRLALGPLFVFVSIRLVMEALVNARRMPNEIMHISFFYSVVTLSMLTAVLTEYFLCTRPLPPEEREKLDATRHVRNLAVSAKHRQEMQDFKDRRI